MILLANLTPLLMFLAGAGLLTFILMKRASRYFGRSRRRRDQGPIELQPRPTSKWDGAQKDTLAHIEREKVEMHEMARDLNGQLTSRIIVLEQLIAESGQQIKRMEELMQKIDQAEKAALAESSLELE